MKLLVLNKLSARLINFIWNNHLNKIQLMMALEMGFYWLQSVHYCNEKYSVVTDLVTQEGMDNCLYI